VTTNHGFDLKAALNILRLFQVVFRFYYFYFHAGHSFRVINMYGFVIFIFCSFCCIIYFTVVMSLCQHSDLVSRNAGDMPAKLQSSHLSSIKMKKVDFSKKQKSPVSNKKDLSLLDLYCGCGGMSTGLCLGARGGGVNLVTVLLLHKHITCAIAC
jgi:hypothetical protein